MGKRLLTAAVLVPLTLGALWLRTVDELYFAFYLNLVAVAAVGETVYQFRDRLPLAVQILLVVFAGATYVLFRFLGFEAVVYAAVLVFLVAFSVIAFAKDRGLDGVGATALILFYPTVVLSVAYVLNARENGLFYMVFLILTACLADVMAYFVGMTLKGPKLCPRLSPKKTVSGAVGGLVGGLLSAVCCYFFFLHVFPEFPVYPIWQLLIAGFFGALFTELGDLCESFLKRRLGIKDFSRLLPGHGGVMDRIDGMLFCCFFTFFYFTVVL